MMKSSFKVILLCLMIFGTTSAIIYSQNRYVKTVVPGNKWRLSLENGSHFPANIHQVLITCDTLDLNGLIYQSVEISGGGGRCGPGGYVREDTLEQRVYFINRDEEDNWEEILIADYSLVQGDTFEWENGWGKQVVKDVRFINFHGGMQAKFIDFGVSVNNGFVEGHGRLDTGILNQCRPVSYPRLTGYKWIDQSCTVVTSTNSIYQEKYVKIGPNPVKDYLRIEYVDKVDLKPIKFELISTLGQTVKVGVVNMDSMIYLTDLQSGTYCLVLTIKGKRIVRKIIHH